MDSLVDFLGRVAKSVSAEEHVSTRESTAVDQPPTLLINIIEARNLPKVRGIGISSTWPPLVSCRFGDVRRSTCGGSPSSTDPVYNEVLEMGTASLGSNFLEICLVDSNPLVPDEPIGSTDIDLNEFEHGGGCLHELWISLDGVASGELHLQILWSPLLPGVSARDILAQATLVPNACRSQSVLEQYLACIETRAFYNWLRALEANPWVLTHALSHKAMPLGALEEIRELVWAGVPSSAAGRRLAPSLVVRDAVGSEAASNGELRRRDLSSLKVSVTGFKVVDQYALFRVSCVSNGGRWVVWRRYSEFRELASHLDPSGGPDPILSLQLAGHIHAGPSAVSSVDRDLGSDHPVELVGRIMGDLSSHVLSSLDPSFLEKRRGVLDSLLKGSLTSNGGLVLHQSFLVEFLDVAVVDQELYSALENLRPDVWLSQSGARQLRAMAEFSDAPYSEYRVASWSRSSWVESMGRDSAVWDSTEAEAFQEIEQDLQRTNAYGDADISDTERRTLRAILRATALAAPEEGYCQVRRSANRSDEGTSLHLVCSW